MVDKIMFLLCSGNHDDTARVSPRGSGYETKLECDQNVNSLLTTGSSRIQVL